MIPAEDELVDQPLGLPEPPAAPVGSLPLVADVPHN